MSKLPTNPAGSQILEADGIRIEFGQRQVLGSIYMRVQTGQIVGLLGRNGSGKSVLLQTVFGARHVADASVRVNGRRVVPAFRQPGLLNYLPQEPLLPPSLTLARAAALLSVDFEQATARFPELRPQRGRRLAELSGGLARLVQALLMLHANTAFSLLDEPFSGVMPVHVETLAEEMQRLKSRKGLLITDHRYAEVLRNYGYLAG
jgi:lipopolysaccharide export system ATP-binding protein